MQHIDFKMSNDIRAFLSAQWEGIGSGLRLNEISEENRLECILMAIEALEKLARQHFPDSAPAIQLELARFLDNMYTEEEKQYFARVLPYLLEDDVSDVSEAFIAGR